MQPIISRVMSDCPICILADLPAASTTFIVLLVLSAVFICSWLMFWILSVRSTSLRRSVLTLDWARDHGFKVHTWGEELPEPFADLKVRGMHVETCLQKPDRMLLRLEEQPPESAAPIRWHLLLRTLPVAWPPTGLRPTHPPRSALDLFSLTGFPLLGPTDRFVVFGTESISARALSRSPARGLLPPDIGLLLAGPHLILDFSARPFDEIEFNRMIVIAEQLLKHLPQPT